MTRDRDTLLLTVAEAAKHAHVDPSTVGRWIRGGILVAIPNGKEKLIPLDHLQQIIRDRHGFEHGVLPRDTLKNGDSESGAR